MRILFIHQNFPAQFKHVGPALAADPTNDVRALTLLANAPESWKGIKLVKYRLARGSTPNVHPWVSDFEAKTIRGEAAFHAALKLRANGFTPDVIIAHPGWGESLFLKEVWPHTPLGMYCEFYYKSTGADVGFDPEFPSKSEGDACRLRLKNLNNFLHFDIADSGLSPTQWQASTFPQAFRERITVAHDGIDTEILRPNSAVKLLLNGAIPLTRNDEVITFVNRNLEPYRGYHIFMRALPELLRRRPNARVLIVGGDGLSYGAPAPDGKKWRDIFFDEVADQIRAEDLARVHFLGAIPYEQFISLLQLSTVHVYLTYPFVLSWSLLEAMSIGCAIVASDTQPLHEAIRHGDTGRLVNFFDVPGLVNEVCSLLDDPAERARLGANARRFAQETYDLKSICLPAQLAWIRSLA